jgi:hypothetical protein
MAEKKIQSLVLAPDVVFDEQKHEYHLRGMQLFGVTGIIGKHLGTKFPEEFVGEARGEGLHVHKAIEDWIDANGRTCSSVHPGVVWVTQTLSDKCSPLVHEMHSEVLVSDLATYASSVDIVAEYDGKVLDIFDMKRTFKRTPVTWQLSIYKYFIETYTDYRVNKMWCVAFRDKEYYPVFAKSFAEVEKLLYRK